MWKTHLTVVIKEFVFHSPCGKRCGNLRLSVEKKLQQKVFQISTGAIITSPVEMWKT
jgi:hypothetical protein